MEFNTLLLTIVSIARIIFYLTVWKAARYIIKDYEERHPHKEEWYEKTKDNKS